MKRIVAVVAGLLIIVLISGLLISPIQEKTTRLTIACPTPAVARQFSSMDKWRNWLPEKIENDTILQIANKSFYITTLLMNGFQALSTDKKIAIDLQYIPKANKETEFILRTTYALPGNSFLRCIAWLTGDRSKSVQEKVIEQCKTFFSQPEKVYGMEIKRDKVKFFSWISTKANFTKAPSTQDIYRNIDALQNYIRSNAAQALGDPILHVHRESATTYELMVAIPTDRDLQTKNGFQLKNMILGSILTATVKGDEQSVTKAEIELENYVKDHQIVSPAIPFQTLVTDRSKEKDSTRWITRVNYPIFD